MPGWGWIDQRLPKMESRDQAQATLLEMMQASVQKYGLDIDRQSFMKPAGTPYYQEVAINMQVDGPERQIYQWLAEMQKPEAFQVIKFLRFEPEGEAQQAQAECNVILARWFKP